MSNKIRFGELLLESGVINEPQLDEVLHRQRGDRRPVGALLVEAGLLSERMLGETLAELVQITNNPEQFLLWFGCNATEPKYPELIESLEGALLPDDILRKLKTHCALVKSPSSRFAYMTRPPAVNLFVDGRHFPLTGNALEAVQLLCERDKFESSETEFLISIKEIRVLLTALLNQGSLILR